MHRLRRQQKRLRRPDGFTVVELLVVISVIGILMSLLLAGVQACRESARRMKCANNIRNQALAVDEFGAAHGHYPAGRAISFVTEYSWSFECLPNLEQSALYNRFDRTKPWGHPGGNSELADTTLAIFRCPSTVTKFAGKTDYGGILGSLLPGIFFSGEIDNGVLVETGRTRPNSVRPGEITDGASHTIVIGECTDREADEGGRWVSGYNALSHNNGGINESKGSDIHSLHPNGAYVAFADGHVQFMSNHIAEYVIGAICTRGGGELTEDF